MIQIQMGTKNAAFTCRPTRFLTGSLWSRTLSSATVPCPCMGRCEKQTHSNYLWSTETRSPQAISGRDRRTTHIQCHPWTFDEGVLCDTKCLDVASGCQSLRRNSNCTRVHIEVWETVIFIIFDLDLQFRMWPRKQCHKWILRTEKLIKRGITHLSMTSMVKLCIFFNMATGSHLGFRPLAAIRSRFGKST